MLIVVDQFEGATFGSAELCQFVGDFWERRGAADDAEGGDPIGVNGGRCRSRRTSGGKADHGETLITERHCDRECILGDGSEREAVEIRTPVARPIEGSDMDTEAFDPAASEFDVEPARRRSVEVEDQWVGIGPLVPGAHTPAGGTVYVELRHAAVILCRHHVAVASACSHAYGVPGVTAVVRSEPGSPDSASPADNQRMRLGDSSAEYQRGAKGSRSRWLTPQKTTCGVSLVVVAILAGCGGGSDPAAPATEDVVKRVAIVSPTTQGWNWPTVPTSSSPYSKNQGGDPPGDKRSATLYRQLRGLDLIGSAGSRWQDESKLAHLVVERFGSPADAHSAMRPYREFAHGWAEQTGAVSDGSVGGLGDEAWRIMARGYTEEVTYKWRRADLILEAHIQCLSACRSDIDEAARVWVDAIDREAQGPSP